MAVWAYECLPCMDPEHPRFVACDVVDALPRDVEIVRIRAGTRWICARLLRGRRLAVEGVVVRDVAASDAGDCPECAERPAGAAGSGTTPAGRPPVA